MKDELEQYWNGYIANAHEAIRDRDARLLRMLDESLDDRSDLGDVLREWRAMNTRDSRKRHTRNRGSRHQR